MIIEDPMLTTQDLAERFRIGRPQARILARTGALPSYRVGRQHLFKTSDVEAYLDSVLEPVEVPTGQAAGRNGIVTTEQ